MLRGRVAQCAGSDQLLEAARVGRGPTLKVFTKLDVSSRSQPDREPLSERID